MVKLADVYEKTSQKGNLYLHYVLDLWFERVVKPRLQGEAYLLRYIDDFVVCF